MEKDIDVSELSKALMMIADITNKIGVLGWTKEDIEDAKVVCELLKKEVGTPLLSIELQDEGSVPVVKYKGEEITGRMKILFDWETKNCEVASGGTHIIIEHADDSISEPNTRKIEHKIGKCAFDIE